MEHTLLEARQTHFSVNQILPTNIYLAESQPKTPHFWRTSDKQGRLLLYFASLIVLFACLVHWTFISVGKVRQYLLILYSYCLHWV